MKTHYTFDKNAPVSDAWLLDADEGIYLMRSLEDNEVWILRALFNDTKIKAGIDSIVIGTTTYRVCDKLPEWHGHRGSISGFIFSTDGTNPLCIKIQEL